MTATSNRCKAGGTDGNKGNNDGGGKDGGRARKRQAQSRSCASCPASSSPRWSSRGAHQDVPGPGVLHPVGVDGEHPARRRPRAGQQARRQAGRDPARRRGRLPDPGGWLTAPGETQADGRPAGPGPLTARLRRPGPAAQRVGPHQAGDRRRAATRSCAATTRAGSRSTASRSTSRTCSPATSVHEPFDVTRARGPALGDGRPPAGSEDSRAHREQPGGASCPVDDVIGRASQVWPIGRPQRRAARDVPPARARRVRR